ncbi:MAG: NADPH-dependent FMN reductase [Bacteriovoracaceae bacterium]
MKICIVTASEGKNLDLALKFIECLSAKEIETALIDLVDLDLPLYTTKNEKRFDVQELLLPIKEKLIADGYVFIAPEYNGSTPPSLSNFFAWVSRSTKNWRETFNSKAAAIATHSAGGGLSVLTVMRLQLAYIGMNVIGRQIHITPQKPLDEASLDVVCNQLIRLAKL